MRRNRTAINSPTSSFDSANSEYHSKSLPQTISLNCEECEKLNGDIEQLRMQLNTANDEIDNLVMENATLKKQTIEQQNIIAKLKTLCSSQSSSTKKHSTLKKNKCMIQNLNITKKNLDKSLIELETKKCKEIIKDGTARSTSENSSSLDLNCNLKQYDLCTTDGAVADTTNTKLSEGPTTITNEVEIIQMKNQRGNVIKEKQRKRKLCVLSNCNNYRPVEIIEDTFSEQFEYCHYVSPNGKMKEILTNITNKIQDFNMDDYCIVMIGEKDFNDNEDSIELVRLIRESLEQTTHTNVIVCSPTYVKGALIHNYRVELFNNLLCMDIQNHNYAYFFDTNRDLSLEMFSYKTGKLNKLGIKCIFGSIFRRILVDIKNYPLDYDHDNSLKPLSSKAHIQNKFFRPTL